MTESISRILVPVDFSAHSTRAFEYAVMLARRFDASIELLHAVDDPSVSGAWSVEIVTLDLPKLMAELVADARRRLRDMKEVTASEGDRVEPLVSIGQPARSIVDHATTGGFDLIVMGTHGRTGLAHAFMGSVAERVIRTARCPVVTVRHPTRADEPTPIETAARTLVV